jgi:hypothetical protein
MVSKPLSTLQTMVTDCTDEFDALSRLVGRKPAARNSMAAARLLPIDLQRTATFGAISEFRRQIETVMSKQGREARIGRRNIQAH